MTTTIRDQGNLPKSGTSIDKKVISATLTINGNPLYYERRGTGDHVLLLIPGALGTGNLHFSKQHSDFDLANFTLISVDPVGYGKSRPAVRPTERHYWVDAKNYHLLMKELEIPRYSILGFSEGGRVGLIMGATYPEEIRKIVTTGTSCHITEEERDTRRPSLQIQNWGPSLQDEMKAIYGDELDPLWNQFLETFSKYTDIFTPELSRVTCPVLILHGQLDDVVLVEHARYLKAHLKDATMYIHSAGPHSFHITVHKLFNFMTQEFLND